MQNMCKRKEGINADKSTRSISKNLISNENMAKYT